MTISAPSANAVVAGVVKITASATDDVKVKKMEIWINGKRAVTRNLATISKSWTVRGELGETGPAHDRGARYDVPGGGSHEQQDDHCHAVDARRVENDTYSAVVGLRTNRDWTCDRCAACTGGAHSGHRGIEQSL